MNAHRKIKMHLKSEQKFTFTIASQPTMACEKNKSLSHVESENV